ncbi:MAG: hypothetical protein GQ529_02060 [Methyloprofundus sp.]|nr:hypothetical protein [Methyloprofundus sp.]
MRTLDREAQQSLTPARALDILQQGNHRFVNNLKTNRDLLQQAKAPGNTHHPSLLVFLSVIGTVAILRS